MNHFAGPSFFAAVFVDGVHSQAWKADAWVCSSRMIRMCASIWRYGVTYHMHWVHRHRTWEWSRENGIFCLFFGGECLILWWLDVDVIGDHFFFFLSFSRDSGSERKSLVTCFDFPWDSWPITLSHCVNVWGFSFCLNNWILRTFLWVSLWVVPFYGKIGFHLAIQSPVIKSYN